MHPGRGNDDDDDDGFSKKPTRALHSAVSRFYFYVLSVTGSILNHIYVSLIAFLKEMKAFFFF